jgi:hypothetical protein
MICHPTVLNGAGQLGELGTSVGAFGRSVHVAGFAPRDSAQ